MQDRQTAWVKPRPIRIAFLVQDGEHSGLMLDGTFADCYDRWGGRFSLIVPCADGQISASYWPWLTTYDPDIVYSYVPLDRSKVLELHERLGPAEYQFHTQRGAPRFDVHGFKPRHGAKPLSSLSTIFRQARYRTATAENPRLKIVDSWHTEQPSRFLSDNLGIYHTSNGGMYPADATPYATLLTICDLAKRADRKFGVPPDLDAVDTELEAFEHFRQRRATSLSVASLLYAPKLDLHTLGWSGAFNLVVGETFADRVMFWNARLLLPSWLDDDLYCLRVSLDQLRDDAWRAQLGGFLKARNRVNEGAGGQSNITVRSCSLDEDSLAEALSLVQATKPWGFVRSEAVGSLDAFVPTQEVLERARETTQYTDFPFQSTETVAYDWTPPTANPPRVTPDHLSDAPNRQVFTRGYWCDEHGFAYPGEPVGFSDRNRWSLPVRWRMAASFKAMPTGGNQHDLPARPRRTRLGNLGLFTSSERRFSAIQVPTAEQAIRHALVIDGRYAKPGAEHTHALPLAKVVWADVSSEAGYLTGVLGMAGSLNRAGMLLLHPFLREVFRRLGGTPNPPAEKLQNSVNRVTKLRSKRPDFNLRNEQERRVLGTLIAQAAREHRNPMAFFKLTDVQAGWQTYREAFWQKHGKPTSDNPEEWDEREAESLHGCLVEMRQKRMLFQGHHWPCSRCHHRNWVDMASLASELACQICGAVQEMPVSFDWLFKPSDFLIESLRDRSVLSLIWMLSELQLRARSSFIYSGPTIFGYESDSELPDAEADLLVLLDGKTIVCEVKSSWSLVGAAEIRALVDLAKRLRPDVAMLGVMEKGDGPIADTVRTLGAELAAESIGFECVTFQDRDAWDNTYLI